MTTLKLWSKGKEMTESGVEIGGIQVTWAEIDLATDRKSAIDIGMTEDLCDDFEIDHKDYGDLSLLVVDSSGGADPPVGPSLCRMRLLRILVVSLSTCCVVKMICYIIISYNARIMSRMQTSIVNLVEILTPRVYPPGSTVTRCLTMATHFHEVTRRWQPRLRRSDR